MRVQLLSWLLVFVAGVPCGVVHAYTFTKIADTAGPYSGFGSSPSAPSINATDAVAFFATLDAGGQAIVRVSGATATTIATADNSDPQPLFGIPTVQPAINAAGVVAFKGNRDTGTTAIFAGSGGPLATIGDSTSAAYDDFGPSPAINDSGVVAFMATSAGVDGVYAGNGTTTTTIADSGATFSFVDGGFGNAVGINNSGAVAFRALANPGSVQGVYKGTDAAPTPIATAALAEVSPTIPLNGPGINGSGVVVFRSSRDAGGEGIFTGSGGSLTTVATSDGAFASFEPSGLYPAINSSGLVAFRATLDAGGNGIFVGPDAVANKVIKVSDPLDGSTVTDLRFSHLGLNDAGHIAFWAMLSDGRSGIFVAVPPSSSLPGDYNSNGAVEAGDYVLWRTAPGIYGGDPAGYNTWRAHFGEPASGSIAGPGGAIPEPSMMALAIGAVVCLACVDRRAFAGDRVSR